jgi:hypothetical protein
LLVLMKSKWSKDTESIKIFKKDIKELNELIPQFQELLKSTTSRKHLGLKSSCFIEKELRIKRKVISFFYRHLHSVSMSSICSLLQPLSRTFQRVSCLRLGVHVRNYDKSDSLSG